MTGCAYLLLLLPPSSASAQWPRRLSVGCFVSFAQLRVAAAIESNREKMMKLTDSISRRLSLIRRFVAPLPPSAAAIQIAPTAPFASPSQPLSAQRFRFAPLEQPVPATA